MTDNSGAIDAGKAQIDVTHGEQDRPMNDENDLEVSLEDSMDALEQHGIKHPAGNGPLPPSGHDRRRDG